MLRMFAGAVLDLVHRPAALRSIRCQQTFGPTLVRGSSFKGLRGAALVHPQGLFPEQNLLR